jgi:hypothetical protein
LHGCNKRPGGCRTSNKCYEFARPHLLPRATVECRPIPRQWRPRSGGTAGTDLYRIIRVYRVQRRQCPSSLVLPQRMSVPYSSHAPGQSPLPGAFTFSMRIAQNAVKCVRTPRRISGLSPRCSSEHSAVSDATVLLIRVQTSTRRSCAAG